MEAKRILTGLITLAMGIAFSGCAANLCERKDRFFERHCSGSDVTWSSDPLCPQNLERCNAGQLGQFEAYVKCLEAQNECSLDAISACAQQYPGGVNLQCAGG